MPTQTPRFNLDKYQPGDDSWSHSDTVDWLDESAVARGPIADRPASGDYDDAMYYATDQLTLYQWDETGTTWNAIGGLGTEANPLPQVYAQTVSADDGTFNSTLTDPDGVSHSGELKDASDAPIAGGVDELVVEDLAANSTNSSAVIKPDGDGGVTVGSVSPITEFGQIDHGSVSGGSTSEVTVTFSDSYSDIPLVFTTLVTTGSFTGSVPTVILSISTSDFVSQVDNDTSNPVDHSNTPYLVIGQ